MADEIGNSWSNWTYNLLYHWFVGLNMDDPVWDVSVFTKNRQRLLEWRSSRRLIAGDRAGPTWRSSLTWKSVRFLFP
jgi:hypothetical protein